MTNKLKFESKDGSRRDFLTLLTASSITVGGIAMTWPFLNSLYTQDITVENSFVDIDISSLQAGQQITFTWQNYPIFILNRTKTILEHLQDKTLRTRLRDPDSKELQQPAYTQNWHRSIEPEIIVMVGVCTHLGCIPTLKLRDTLDGYYNCACHGSKFDLAGRVFQGMPAPYNLAIPPYRYLKPTVIRVGENPKGHDFDIHSVQQI
ncbi:Ubiquinol-cytochrome c reductase iron-sulfur subunit [Commensalibacter sp. Nvir]|uniref:ubiquinol-cytochrome c reductase iron-sulfur subunit n=1 Tax=Commensalibacter sp. Nvir TaxID=3069817 RepID=UPI002D499C49|nr:Ubiquinol-cytochrome c reductase iron-sulfur subunit [Commensalibacter sp. Nvir]